jgi:hypothetical protein
MEQKLLWWAQSWRLTARVAAVHFAAQHDIPGIFVMYNARHPRADNVSKKYGAGPW